MRKIILGLALVLGVGAAWLESPQQAHAQRFGISVGTPNRYNYGGNYGSRYGYNGYGNNWYGNNRYGNNWYGNNWYGDSPYNRGGIYLNPQPYIYNSRPSYYYDPAPSYSVAPTVQTGTFGLEVHVPVADARVWFNKVDSGQSGTVRWFETSNLTMGQTYTFQAEARWMEDGREVVERQTVTARPGVNQRIDFQRRQPGRTTSAQ